MSTSQRHRVTRRQFLIGAGTALAGAALACGRESEVATRVVSTSAPAPAFTPTGAPTRQATPSITPTASAPGSADVLLLNGKVITVDAADTITQAVAVKDGLIQAVGSSEKVKALAGEKTKTVDLKGKVVTPGLIDAHNHLQVVGLMDSYYTAFLPPEVKSIPELQKKLAEIVAKTPKGEWIKGYYWTVGESKTIKRQDLDTVSPDHPVWLMQQGGHYGSANSLAIKMAGITSATPNPTGGIIERDASGQPTGVFYNHRAMDLLRKDIPLWTLDMARENIVTTQSRFAACGVTSFQDNNVRGTDVIATYLEAGKQGKMTLRGAVYYTIEWPQDLDRALKEIEHYQDPFMRFAGFKFLIDGQPPTAYCHQPHNGIQWNMPTWEPQSFKKAVRALHDTGLQICVHCAGDAAADLTLDAYAEAMKANPRPDPRHRIEHAVLTTPEATKRIKDLGVVVCTQPQFLRSGGDYWETIFGEQRNKRAIVTREWLNAGIVVALGSDAPTTPWYTPQATLAGAVSRLTASGRVHEPDQRMTIQEALRAHTMDSAYAAHEEKIKGSIEVGKLADLAVWNEDPYTASVQQLWNATIAMSIVGGKIVYQA
jgi:predicted amidohydrolase YtcJ